MPNYINTQTNQYPLTEQEIKSQFPDTSFPAQFIAPEPYQVVFDSPQPTFDQYTQKVVEKSPALTNKGVYERTYEVIGLEGDELTDAQQRKAIDDAQKESQRIAALWQAAHDYEYQAISGSAVGLITMGVMQSLPKAIAVQNWIKSIWTEYYARKASGSTDCDFSVAGTCPHTVPELMGELGF